MFALLSGQLAAEPVSWAWSGAVTTRSAQVKARVPGEGRVDVLVAPEATPTATRRFPERFTREGAGRVAHWTLDRLEPGVRYRYVIVAEGEGPGVETVERAFRTPAAGAQSFSVAFGACAKTASDHAVFRTIASHDPLFFLHLGDSHYLNIDVADPVLYADAFDRVLTAPSQAMLYGRVAVEYVWDDHDSVGNDATGKAAHWPAAMAAWRLHVPHRPLVAGTTGPIHRAFTVGRVRFVVMDTRSARSGRDVPEGPDRTMLGAAQKSWLLGELEAAHARHALIVLVSSVPWIADDGSLDRWGSFTDERREIATFIRDRGIDRICLVSGDAHMLAADDGTHNQYALGGGPGFPVYQAGALEQRGSVKGGPYTHGTFPGPGHFGLLEITDDGGATVRVRFTGRDAEDEVLVEHGFEARLSPRSPGAPRP